ncbi:hypothetical protein [Streptomyces sp. SAI-090]|jgi:hypothetical protein|nr:hypothetical protein [Streptomyces sp. SAI-090]MDH6522320.1 hypothetical protein [Streptomyces sp. SAI-090]
MNVNPITPGGGDSPRLPATPARLTMVFPSASAHPSNSGMPDDTPGM